MVMLCSLASNLVYYCTGKLEYRAVTFTPHYPPPPHTCRQLIATYYFIVFKLSLQPISCIKQLYKSARLFLQQRVLVNLPVLIFFCRRYTILVSRYGT
jgi:hypothetical protein